MHQTLSRFYCDFCKESRLTPCALCRQACALAGCPKLWVLLSSSFWTTHTYSFSSSQSSCSSSIFFPCPPPPYLLSLPPLPPALLPKTWTTHNPALDASHALTATAEHTIGIIKQSRANFSYSFLITKGKWK